jgi:hypothetical protein
MDLARNITVGVRRSTDGYHLIIRFDDGGKPLVSQSIPELEIARSKLRLSNCLDGLYDAFWQGNLLSSNYEKFTAAFRSLHEFTSNFLIDFFGREGHNQFCKRLSLLRSKGMSNLILREYPLGIIEYEAQVDELLPLDYLFIPYKGYIDSPKNIHELILALSNILGFSYIIRRNPPQESPETTSHGVKQGSSHVNKLKVALNFDKYIVTELFSNPNLTHAHDEISFFQEENSHIFAGAKNLPKSQKYDVEMMVERMTQQPDIQIFHFCCHCEAENIDPWKHFIDLGSERVTISNLRHVLSKIEGPICVGNRIAFLNTCNSAIVTPLSKSSFPILFLNEFNYVGFIGPELRIPDKFAYEFSRVFYSNFIAYRELGMALFKTRWFFAKKYNNPMGLFYILYANSEVILSGPPKNPHL